MEKAKYQHSCQALTGTKGKSGNQHMLACLRQVIPRIASVPCLAAEVSLARLFKHENVGLGESMGVQSSLFQLPLLII